MARAQSRTAEGLMLQVLLAELSKPQQEKLLAESKSRMDDADNLIDQFEKQVATQQARQKVGDVKAKGDLTGADINTITQDEVGQLVKAFNGMAGNLRRLVRQVSESAQQVAAASETLTEGAEQSAQATTQIATSIMEVAEGTVQQSKTVDDTTKTIEQMAAHMQQMSANANTVVEVANQSAGTPAKVKRQ